jgi:capsular exopolysaccharide synthesis family protein
VSERYWSTAIDSEQDATAVGLRHYFDVVRRRKWIVIAVFAISVFGALIFSITQDPVYRAQSKILVGQGGGLYIPTAINVNQPYTATMADLIKSNDLATRVLRRLHLNLTPEQLLAKAHVSINPETSVMKLSVDDHSRDRAQAINREIGIVFAALVKRRLGQGSPATSGGTAIPPVTATIWDPAHVLPLKVSPRPMRNIVIAGALGFILGLLAAFLRDHFDRGLRTREMVEQAFGIPVIGMIPFARLRRKDQRIVFWQGFSDVAEAFRALRANLQYLAVKRPIRTILITSAAPGQGKTTVAANLALAIARSGATTIVLEGDLRRPRLDDAFDVHAQGPGLTSVLVGAVDLDEAIIDVTTPTPVATDGVSSDREGRLSILPSGPLPPNPSELLSSLQMTKLLDRLALAYDYVLIDSPPVLAVADALELARIVDGVVVVARRDRATRDEAREIRALVERLGINLLGVVFTDVAAASGYYGYGRYGYGGRPEAPQREERPEAAAEDELEPVGSEEF